LNLLNMAAKCHALFLPRMWSQGERDRTLTADWFGVLALLVSKNNPPNIRAIPQSLAYLCLYFLDWAYIEPERPLESRRKYKRRVYDTLRTILNAENKPREVRVMTLRPHIDWKMVWGNLQSNRLPERVRRAWYMIIHDLMPTNVRLHRIRLRDAVNCPQCRRQDMKLQRLTEYGVGREIWERTRLLKARIRRTEPRCVPTEWILHPSFKLWPRQRNRAVVWVLAIWCFM
jgi:hypothetical protein